MDVDTNRVPRDRTVSAGEIRREFRAGTDPSAGASIGLPDSRHVIPIRTCGAGSV